MQMQEFSITFFWLISCTAVYSGIVEYRVIISNRGALCAYTVKHAPERSTAVPVRERVTSFILILPVSSTQSGSAFCTLRLPLEIPRSFSAANLHAAR
jgi:hypothetical protein